MFIRKALSAIAMAGAVSILGAGIASADITTSNDAKGESTSRAGTQAAEVDHMAGEPNDGNLEAAAPGHVWKVIKRTPRVDENGDPVLGSNGRQIIDLTWGQVPVSSGPDDAEIIHNP